MFGKRPRSAKWVIPALALCAFFLWSPIASSQSPIEISQGPSSPAYWFGDRGVEPSLHYS